MNMKRRTFLRSSAAASAVGVAVGAGLLSPQAVLAAWPKKAFEAESLDGAMEALTGKTKTSEGDIQIKAPDIAENGAVVPVTVSAEMDGAESIAIFAAKNANPLTSDWKLGPGAKPFVSTRIKMGETSDVVAVVNAGGKLYSARKEVKVTIGGCGG